MLFRCIQTPNVDLLGSGNAFPVLPTASRSGNTLCLAFAPFGDNTPGHVGAGFSAASSGTRAR